MNVEILARKLQPLMPNEVKQWMRTRDLDAGMRELVEQQITSMAYRVFGDFRVESCSACRRARNHEEHCAGHGALRTREVVVFSIGKRAPAELGRVRPLGAGKTNAVFHLLQQLHGRHVPVLFLDWKRTGRHLLPLLKGDVGVFTPRRPLAPFAFDPLLVPPGVESSVYVNHLVDVIADSFTLGDGAKSLLHKTFNAAYTKGQGQASLDDATRELEQIPDKERVRAGRPRRYGRWRACLAQRVNLRTAATIHAAAPRKNDDPRTRRPLAGRPQVPRAPALLLALPSEAGIVAA
ncbi:MAG: hypothetical protein HS102_07995 [Planctomycetia bacterium]|nr:hypothetical protein [Planctomycetia bacterium]